MENIFNIFPGSLNVAPALVCGLILHPSKMYYLRLAGRRNPDLENGHQKEMVLSEFYLQQSLVSSLFLPPSSTSAVVIDQFMLFSDGRPLSVLLNGLIDTGQMKHYDV